MSTARVILDASLDVRSAIVYATLIEIVAVAASRPGVRALERAERADVEAGVFPAGPGETREARDAALGEWLDAARRAADERGAGALARELGEILG